MFKQMPYMLHKFSDFSVWKIQITFVSYYIQYKRTAFYVKQHFCYEDSSPLFKEKYQESL